MFKKNFQITDFKQKSHISGIKKMHLMQNGHFQRGGYEERGADLGSTGYPEVRSFTEKHRSHRESKSNQNQIKIKSESNQNQNNIKSESNQN